MRFAQFPPIMIPRQSSRCLLNIGFALLIVAMSMSGAGYAQVLYGSLTGNLTDPSGAVVPGAKVEALNTGTGVKRDTTTDDRGAYLFTNLQQGVYKVTVTASSFRPVLEDNVRVSVNDVPRADFRLQIAQVTEAVEVSAAAVALQTDRSDVRYELGSQEVAELPYNGGQGRNFQSLYILIPGAAPPNETNSDAGNPQRAQQLYMNGVSSTNTNTKLDGTTISYPWLPRLIAYVPSSEAVQTVNIVTNAFDAEQGMAGGVAVNVAIKSGTNNFHGSLYEYNQISAYKARDYFDYSGNALPKNILNQFGFAVGGPVWIPKLYDGRSKLFFFVDWQGTRRRQFANALNLTLPVEAWRRGDFSALTGVNQVIYDPLTGDTQGRGRQRFFNNIIPAYRIDSASATMASLLPSLTRPNQISQNIDAYGSYSFDRDNIDIKINHNPTSKLTYWGRYSISPMNILSPQYFDKAGGDGFGPNAQPGSSGGRVQSVGLGLTYIITPNLLLDGNAGFSRQNIGGKGDFFNGKFGLDVLKIPGTNGSDVEQYGIPAFFFSGQFANLGNGNTGSPFHFRDNVYTSGVNLSWVKGAHNLRFGFGYDHSALNHFQPQAGNFGTARGAFTFNGTLTASNGPLGGVGDPVTQPSSANVWADFLLGFPSRIVKATQFTNPNSLRFSGWSWYARDQWQVTRSLTVNYGTRWEHYPIWSHDNFGAVRFDPATGNILIGCLGSTPCDTGAEASGQHWAPRIGIAQRLGAKTVIRTGYGISIDPDNFRNQRNAFPSTIVQDFNQPGSYQFPQVPAGPGGANVNGSLRVGIPPVALPDISSGVITPSGSGGSTLTTYGTGTSTQTFPKDFRRGYVESWNFIIQRELPKGIVAEVGYVGTHGVRTITAFNINGSPPGAGAAAGRLLGQWIRTDLNSHTPWGSQKYNALQTRALRRSGGSQIGVSYTFSKALNTGDDGDSPLQRVPPVDTALNKGLAGFDRTHNLQISYFYQFPFGKRRRWLNQGPISYIIGGWAVSGIVSRMSGTPFSINASSTSLNAAGHTQLADQVKPTVEILGGHGQNDPYFDPYAFANVTQVRFGTSGRNIVRGPGVFAWHSSLSRTFALGEKFKLALRGEAFNLTNTPIFNNPGNNVQSVTYDAAGQITNYGGFSIITGASGARQLQVAAKLTF